MTTQTKEISYHATTVDHSPALCPDCGSAFSKVTKTEWMSNITIKRWHDCENCPYRFRSFQTLSAVDAARAKMQEADHKKR